VLNVGTKVTIKISDFVDGGTYRINIATQKIKYDLLPIYTGKTQGIVTKAVPTVTNEWSFFLDESGTTYAIKVTRLATDPAKDKDKDIFTENLQTRARYYFGSHIGVFVPFGQSTKYSLGYMTPSDTNATIMENKRQNVTMVFIGSIYPFGFEPEGEVLTPRRVQVNLATELSGSIFQKIYFGLGYDFTYFSISLLGRFGATDELQNGFKPGDLITGSLKSVPTVSKNKWDWGMTLNLPIDLMMGWLGKSLGLK
jgi:hypothetical protein